LLETQSFKNLRNTNRKSPFNQISPTSKGGFYLCKKTIKFTRLFAVPKNSIKMSFLLLYCTKNNEKQQFTRIKNPLLLEKSLNFLNGMDFNLTKWIFLFHLTF